MDLNMNIHNFDSSIKNCWIFKVSVWNMYNCIYSIQYICIYVYACVQIVPFVYNILCRGSGSELGFSSCKRFFAILFMVFYDFYKFVKGLLNCLQYNIYEGFYTSTAGYGFLISKMCLSHSDTKISTAPLFLDLWNLVFIGNSKFQINS